MRSCQEILRKLQGKRESNNQSKQDFQERFEEILSVISVSEEYKSEVESYAEVRLLQHDCYHQELEEIEFKLQELNLVEHNSLLLLEEELRKIEQEMNDLSFKYRFTKVFFWE